MVEKENISPPRLTAGAVKRASAMDASNSQPPSKKNRVAVSGLPNPPNAVTLPGDEEYEVEDLQVAASYASGLYQFLRSKEGSSRISGQFCQFWKYNEITPCHVEDICYVTDNICDKQEVMEMETDVLKILEFEMGGLTINTFLQRFIKAGL